MTKEYTLDSLDMQILRELQENSRAKNTEIAARLDVSEGAIRKRINKLVDNNFIEKFTIQMSEKVYTTWAVITIKIGGTIGPSKIREQIIEKIDKGLEVIYETAGDVDIIAIMHTTSDSALKSAIEKVREIEGVKNTRTHVVLKRTKLPDEFF